MEHKRTAKDHILSVILGILCIAWVYPIFMILFNSLKKETSISTGTAFQLPNSQGLQKYPSMQDS